MSQAGLGLEIIGHYTALAGAIFSSRLTALLTIRAAAPRWTGYCSPCPHDLNVKLKRVAQMAIKPNFRGKLTASDGINAATGRSGTAGTVRVSDFATHLNGKRTLCRKGL